MPQSKPPSDRQLAITARLRAAGASWAVVGRELKRKPETVMKWPAIDPAKWKRLYRSAARELARDITAESVVALRTDLRSNDDKARRDAAAKLLRFGLVTTKRPVRKLKAGDELPDTAIVQFARYIETLSPDQLATLVRQFGFVRTEPPFAGPAT